MARPKLEINEEQVEKLSAINCSLEEIASILDCSVDTLSRRFAEALKRGRNQGKVSVKRKQFEVAMKGNVTMLIWCGKIMLGQRDPASDIKFFADEIRELPQAELIALAKKKIAESDEKIGTA